METGKTELVPLIFLMIKISRISDKTEIITMVLNSRMGFTLTGKLYLVPAISRVMFLVDLPIIGLEFKPTSIS